MSAQNTSNEIIKTIEIDASQAHVFETFVGRISQWWPLAKFKRSKDHTPQSVVIERFVGGMIFEQAANGDKLSWGSVKLFDPPSTLVMEWHLGRPVSTEVEVTFTALSENRTSVRLVHRGWEKLETSGATVERIGYDQGWSLIFEQAFRVVASNVQAD
jgi:uncharacterized protein YndB with AHSA1/START domain